MKFLAIGLLVLVGCTKAPSGGASQQKNEDPLWARGKLIYQSNCTACHNVEPDKPGSIGPAVTGSSIALLEARVIKATYPEGYTPKAKTKAMLPMPQLEKEISALHKYLN